MKKVLYKYLLIAGTIGLILGGVTGCKRNEEPPVEPSTEAVECDLTMYDDAADFIDEVYGYTLSGTISGEEVGKQFPEQLQPLMSSYDSIYVEFFMNDEFANAKFFDKKGGKQLTELYASQDEEYWDLSQTVTVMDEFKDDADIVNRLMDETDDAVFVGMNTGNILGGSEFNNVIKSCFVIASDATVRTSDSGDCTTAYVENAAMDKITNGSVLCNLLKLTNGNAEISMSFTGEPKSRSCSITIHSEGVSFDGGAVEETHVTSRNEIYSITEEEFDNAVSALAASATEASSEVEAE